MSKSAVKSIKSTWSRLPVMAHYGIAVAVMLLLLGSYVSAKNNNEYGVFTPFPKVFEKNVTKEEPVAFGEEKVDDPNLDSGKTEVRREGKNGIRTYTYKVTIKGKKEINRVLVSDQITTAPLNKMVASGTKSIAVQTSSQVGTGTSRSTAGGFQFQAPQYSGSHIHNYSSPNGFTSCIESSTYTTCF